MSPVILFLRFLYSMSDETLPPRVTVIHIPGVGNVHVTLVDDAFVDEYLHPRLFIGQLPLDVTLCDLELFFGAYGQVLWVQLVVQNRNAIKPPHLREFRGCAIVVYKRVSDADCAIKALHDKFWWPCRCRPRKLCARGECGEPAARRFLQVSYARSTPILSVYGLMHAAELKRLYPSNPIPSIYVVLVGPLEDGAVFKEEVE